MNEKALLPGTDLACSRPVDSGLSCHFAICSTLSAFLGDSEEREQNITVMGAHDSSKTGTLKGLFVYPSEKPASCGIITKLVPTVWDRQGEKENVVFSNL